MEREIASLDIPKFTIQKLRELGFNNLSDIEPDFIKEKLGVELEDSIKEAPDTKTALEIYNEELVSGSILSYNEKLDSVLKDIIVPKTITELAGESGSGKTQVCFQICISVQLPKWCGGMEREAIYIDTNSNFASHRVTELAKDFTNKYKSIKPSVQVRQVKFDENFILKHIYYTKVCNYVELTACVGNLEHYLSDKNVGLIVIDSFSFVMRMVEAKDRRTLTSKLFCQLRTLAKNHNLAVVITNDLTTRTNKGVSYATPSFGDSFYHLVNSRVLLSRTNNLFHAKLEKSIHGQKETFFYL